MFAKFRAILHLVAALCDRETISLKVSTEHMQVNLRMIILELILMSRLR